MVEYIKRDAALKVLCQVSAPTPDESHIVEKCIEKIYILPMMEVVRCKDCKHCKMCYPEKQIGKEATPGWYCKEHKRYRRPDDFCSDGERREGE